MIFLQIFKNVFKFDFSIILGDFNARSKLWWKNDVDTNGVTIMDPPASSYGLHQLISQTTHLLINYSSCTDLIFTDQPSLVVDYGTHSSLYPNCHHQIISCKLDI